MTHRHYFRYCESLNAQYDGISTGVQIMKNTPFCWIMKLISSTLKFIKSKGGTTSIYNIHCCIICDNICCFYAISLSILFNVYVIIHSTSQHINEVFFWSNRITSIIQQLQRRFLYKTPFCTSYNVCLGTKFMSLYLYMSLDSFYLVCTIDIPHRAVKHLRKDRH